MDITHSKTGFVWYVQDAYLNTLVYDSGTETQNINPSNSRKSEAESYFPALTLTCFFSYNCNWFVLSKCVQMWKANRVFSFESCQFFNRHFSCCLSPRISPCLPSTPFFINPFLLRTSNLEIDSWYSKRTQNEILWTSELENVSVASAVKPFL